MTTEESIFVDITLNNGMIYLEKGPANKIFEGEFVYSNQPPEINYEIVGDEGRLTIHFDEEGMRQKGEENKFKRLSSLEDLYDNECRLKLSPNLPIVLNLDLGITKGELKLGGLQLKEINFASGVSRTNINFDEPNPITLEYFDVEAGVGALEIYNLGNANFKRFNFEGGIGDYVIDFAGNHYGDTKVDVDVGLGKVKLYLPRSAGIRMKVDKSFLCSFDIDEIYKENDFYYNQKWGKTTNSLDMNVETGIGKISVVWIED
ncbi:MAG: hypothetical protein GWN01_00705 [Nitrosopumilaceae archaeon]|nr:cell wall-active antibiotics response protein [Nitrosopumilaceae archaeon]NIV64716.1 hypothetical protein [Nitrosopumilaceae archaeon]NIX60103.1 hypothetical protein [Nitrosopumilaceae archaeon]